MWIQQSRAVVLCCKSGTETPKVSRLEGEISRQIMMSFSRCISWSPVLSFTYSCPFMFLMKWQRQQPQATRCLEHTRRRCKPSVGAWLSYLLYLESCCLFKGWFMCSESNQNRLATPTAIPQLYHVNTWISYTHAMVHWCQETSVSLLWSLSFNSQHSR